MKGLIFTEFLDTVDETFGDETTDRMLDRCPHVSGAYTAVGTYEPAELCALISGLSAETGVGPGDLQRVYAHRLMKRFEVLYPAMFAGSSTAFDFLISVESEIHVDVLKLYPDAELPSIRPILREPRRLVLRYRSPRRLEDLCLGMIEGVLAYFEQEGHIEMIPMEDADGVYHDFDIRLVEGPSA